MKLPDEFWTQPTETGSGASSRRRARLSQFVLVFGLTGALAVLAAQLAGLFAKRTHQQAARNVSSLLEPSVRQDLGTKLTSQDSELHEDVTEAASEHPAIALPEDAFVQLTGQGLAEEHPIEPALRIARDGLSHMRQNVADYTATLTQRERPKSGELPEATTMFCKIRNRRLDAEGHVIVPLSVYLKFQKPKSIAGREVIWVEDQNNGKLIAHEVGLKNLFRFQLDPKGFIAMLGQRYSIDNIGLENLTIKLIERGEQELPHDDCHVTVQRGVSLNERQCTVIQVMHPTKAPHHEYYMAKIHIDEARQIPLRYTAYQWPATVGGEPLVDEEYIYNDVKLNVGLTDADFDPDNPQYDYP